jgi:cephalosporin hydroxylase
MLTSVLIPARNEIYLEQTIRNVLANIRGDSEILIMLDGYIPETQIVTGDDRVRFFHNREAKGQRASINELARQAKGKFIMKLDAHCAVDEGFDVKLAEDCEYDWTVIPRMYNLDVKTFTPKLRKRTDYMYIGMNERGELRSLYYGGEQWKEMHRRTELIDDTMGCMGPGWFMHKERFWELGGCDETQGGPAGWGQQGIEVACKAWLSGGRLVVNKKTWFAHWFRASDGGFPYPIKESDIQKTREYSKDLWLNNKWEGQKRNFQWLIDKFNPPGWDTYMKYPEYDETFERMYKHIHRQMHYPKYKGLLMQKFPNDMQLYHQVIWEKKPDVVVEIGTRFGASALFFQDQLDYVGNGGKVITIDINPQVVEHDPRITYLIGNSNDDDIVRKIQELTAGKSVMVVIDGNHSRTHVKWELTKYKNIVTSGQYMVVEDCYVDRGLYGPGEARDWFLAHTRSFKKVDLHNNFLYGITNGAWLLKT